MKGNRDIVFRGIPTSPMLIHLLENKLQKLERFAQHILKSHITIAMPHKHKKNGSPFRVSIELKLEDEAVVVSNEGEDLHETVAQVFASLTRKVKRIQRKKRARRYQTWTPYTEQLESSFSPV